MELKKKKRVIWSSDRREKSSSACARISTFEMVKYIVRPNLSSLLFLRIIRKKKKKQLWYSRCGASNVLWAFSRRGAVAGWASARNQSKF